MSLKKFVFFSILVFGHSCLTFAKPFQNSFIRFELPNQWSCVLAGSEWLCHPESPAKLREALIVVGAKVAGLEDSPKVYKEFLQKPRTISSRLGAQLSSQLLQIAERNIHGQVWMDALHLNSEVEDFYSRYLVTKLNKLSILVTLNVHKLKYTEYLNAFNEAVASLTVIAPNSLSMNPPDDLPAWREGMNPGTEALAMEATPKVYNPKSLLTYALLAGALVLAGASIYVYRRSARPRRRKR